jgi:quinohemoprotein amine dehydrogenase
MRIASVVLLGSLCLAAPAPAQAQPPPAAPDEGTPVTDAVVVKACGSCHAADAQQRLSRISFQRSTPEGWQDTIKRMVALNGVQLDPGDARHIVKVLSNTLGLAPDEARPAAFEVEKRLVDYKYAESADVEGVCNRCHSLGRVISQRRTRGEWDLLIAMHRGWYPLVDRQIFRRAGPAPRDRGPDGRPPDTRHPVEKAVDHLAKAFPFSTPAWSAWSASMRPARLDGTWALSGWDPGKGPVYGRVTIAAVPNTSDEFTTQVAYTYARSGQTVTRSGRSVVYTGFQWRGRTTVGSDDATSLREVLFVERDWRTMSGRWFTGGYDELGLDVTLTRVGRETQILGTDHTGLRAGGTGQELRIFGANLPAAPQPRDLDLGPGVTVASVVSATPDVLTVRVDVAATAAVGPRDLFLAGGAAPARLVVYDRVDAVKVAPTWSMARTGGASFPKQLAQFEAWAMHNGQDGKPDTPDDLKIDMVPATWSLEEYTATYDDDDLKFVGAVDPATGLFTPAIEGPNVQRSGERNNIGDVWVVARVDVPAGGTAKASTLRGRAHLLVTVPLYQRWNPTVIP